MGKSHVNMGFFSHVNMGKSHVNMGFFSEHDVGKKSHVNMEHLFLMDPARSDLGSTPSPYTKHSL
jgi:hypothetical protein